MSDLLYNHEEENTIIHTYLINGGGTHSIKDSGKIIIKFLNGKFQEAHFPFSGYYTRNQWRILASIESEIARLESTTKNQGESK